MFGPDYIAAFGYLLLLSALLALWAVSYARKWLPPSGCGVIAIVGLLLMLTLMSAGSDQIQFPQSLFALVPVAGVAAALAASRKYDRNARAQPKTDWGRSSMDPAGQHEVPSALWESPNVGARDLAPGSVTTRAPELPVISERDLLGSHAAPRNSRIHPSSYSHHAFDDQCVRLLLQETLVKTTARQLEVDFEILRLTQEGVRELSVFALDLRGRTLARQCFRSTHPLTVGDHVAMKFRWSGGPEDVAFWWAYVCRQTSVTVPRVSGGDSMPLPERPLGWTDADHIRGIRIPYHGPAVGNERSRIAHHPDCLALGHWRMGSGVKFASIEDAESNFYSAGCTKCMHDLLKMSMN